MKQIDYTEDSCFRIFNDDLQTVHERKKDNTLFGVIKVQKTHKIRAINVLCQYGHAFGTMSISTLVRNSLICHFNMGTYNFIE